MEDNRQRRRLGDAGKSQVRRARDYRAEKARRDSDERTRRQRQNAMVKAIEDSRGMIHLALKQAKIPVRTHYDWLDRYPRYKERYEEALQRAYDLVEFKGIVAPAHGGNYAAADKFLSARCPERGYGRHRSEFSGPDGGPIEVTSPTLEDILRATAESELRRMVATVRDELGED